MYFLYQLYWWWLAGSKLKGVCRVVKEILNKRDFASSPIHPCLISSTYLLRSSHRILQDLEDHGLPALKGIAKLFSLKAQFHHISIHWKATMCIILVICYNYLLLSHMRAHVWTPVKRVISYCSSHIRDHIIYLFLSRVGFRNLYK